jgi:hypothetical protein
MEHGGRDDKAKACGMRFGRFPTLEDEVIGQEMDDSAKQPLWQGLADGADAKLRCGAADERRAGIVALGHFTS